MVPDEEQILQRKYYKAKVLQKLLILIVDYPLNMKKQLTISAQEVLC